MIRRRICGLRQRRALHVQHRTANHGHGRLARVNQRFQLPTTDDGIYAVQRLTGHPYSWWSGAGSNCRPSAFQPVFPLPGPFPRDHVKAQLTHVTAGQWTNVAMLPLFRPGPPTSVLSVGFLCQHAHSQPLCGHSVGPEPQPTSFRAPADRSRSPRLVSARSARSGWRSAPARPDWPA
jgi:hypothetical protein